MGKISPIYYEEVSEETMNVRKAAEFYYHSNVYSFDILRFSDDYEAYEKMNMDTRLRLIGKVQTETGQRLKADTSSLGISSLKKKVILVSESA